MNSSTQVLGAGVVPLPLESRLKPKAPANIGSFADDGVGMQLVPLVTEQLPPLVPEGYLLRVARSARFRELNNGSGPQTECSVWYPGVGKLNYVTK